MCSLFVTKAIFSIYSDSDQHIWNNSCNGGSDSFL